MGTWKLFSDDLELHEARKSEISSLNDCFTQKVSDDARTVNRSPSVLVKP